MAKPGLEGKRKPYTVTKKDTHTNWSEVDHQLFLQGMAQHCVDGKRNWQVISTQTFASTKTAAQIRSHAQKYFQKCEEEGDHCQIIQPRKKAKAKVRLVLPHDHASCDTDAYSFYHSTHTPQHRLKTNRNPNSNPRLNPSLPMPSSSLPPQSWRLPQTLLRRRAFP